MLSLSIPTCCFQDYLISLGSYLNSITSLSMLYNINNKVIPMSIVLLYLIYPLLTAIYTNRVSLPNVHSL